jgi:pteridine reductase
MTDKAPLALITGGMRRVGAAIAKRLALAGYDLALSSHVDGGPEPELAATLHAQSTNWHGFCSSTMPRFSGRMIGRKWMRTR